MSNKAITTNDLKAVLDVVLPPQPSEYRKLLWTNPSPTSAFSAQTITLDLSDFDAIEIIRGQKSKSPLQNGLSTRTQSATTNANMQLYIIMNRWHRTA